jgi:hypothetical protein
MRAVAPSPVTLKVDDTLLRVFHPFTQSSELPVPTTPTAFDIEVFPTFATFDTGHRIRLDVGTGDAPHMTLSAPHQAQSAGAVFMVDRDPANPSYVSLPVMASSNEAAMDAASVGSLGAVQPGAPPSAAAAVSLPNTAPMPVPAWPSVAGVLLGAGVVLARKRGSSRESRMRRDTPIARQRGVPT